MAHFVETMMYVGELPWHKLGTYAGQEDVTGAEALKLAQIDWKVRKAPAYALLGHDSVSGQPIFKAIADQFSIVRSHDGEPIEAHEPLPNVTVGSVYAPLQNSQLSELCDALRTAAGATRRTIWRARSGSPPVMARVRASRGKASWRAALRGTFSTSTLAVRSWTVFTNFALARA